MLRKAVGGWRARVEGVQPKTGRMWVTHETGTPWDASHAKRFKTSEKCWHHADGSVVEGQGFDGRYDLQLDVVDSFVKRT